MQFRVVEVASGAEHRVEAKDPEHAAELALNEKLVRSGAKQYLRAKVYWHPSGQPLTLVRLYTMVEPNHH